LSIGSPEEPLFSSFPLTSNTLKRPPKTKKNLGLLKTKEPLTSTKGHQLAFEFWFPNPREIKSSEGQREKPLWDEETEKPDSAQKQKNQARHRNRKTRLELTHRESTKGGWQLEHQENESAGAQKKIKRYTTPPPKGKYSNS